MRYLIVLLLAGCASIEPSAFVGPNGGNAYSMRCSGMGRTLDACYKTAGELCRSGYSIISQTNTMIAVPVNNSFMAAPKQELAIECK